MNIFKELQLILEKISKDNNIRSVRYENNEIIVPDDYPTIQDAIDNCNINDTIRVKPGVYKEHITIVKPLTIMGLDRNSTIIDGSFAENDIVVIDGFFVELSNFTIQNSNSSNSGIMINTNNNRILENTIINCGFGIKSIGNENNIIVNNYCSDNIFGILLNDCNSSQIKNNNLIKNTYGFYFERSIYEKKVIEFQDNRIKNNLRDGMHLYYIDELIIQNCNISNNYHSGIIIFGGSNSDFYDNKFYNNTQGIKMHKSKNNRIIYNVLYEECSTGTDNTNGDLNSKIGILALMKSNNNLFHHNDIYYWINAYDCCKNQYYFSNEGNYWCNYQGWDQDHDGIGDTPFSVPGGDNIDPFPLIDPCNKKLYN
jgi:nitrous oxidase accessory protein